MKLVSLSFLNLLLFNLSLNGFSSTKEIKTIIHVDPHFSEYKGTLEEKGYQVLFKAKEAKPGDFILLAHQDDHISENEPFRIWGLLFQKGEGLEKTAKGNFMGESKKGSLKAVRKLLMKVPKATQLKFRGDKRETKRKNERRLLHSKKRRPWLPLK